MEFFLSYGLFLAKTVTIVFGVILTFSFAFSAGNKKHNKKGNFKIVNVSKKYSSRKQNMMRFKMNAEEYKKWRKSEKRAKKIKEKKNKDTKEREPCLFIINFKGTVDAEEVNSLRKEITTILSIAEKHDEVLLNLESPGGTVNGYGLAAAQLERLKKKVKLTISIDKIAASGGYMMACVADYIIAAPFSVVGSIGVVGQVPNIYRFLKKQNVDIELHTAGQHKRTLTFLGENTESGRKKFIQDLNNTHILFKKFVQKNRPNLDIDIVSTGEYWYGVQAKEKGLIDELSTSDEYILKNVQEKKIISIRYVVHKGVLNKILNIFSTII
ncbi:protease SohB [Candidatus Riesia pediculischaeffi]|uniref:Putative protease sohB n=1 Tax=Candidatus Riesia pediculischaeffi PTSU TaxID=1401651 RepID=A0A0C1V7J6_9ENTR|nr:protease SohB [Candidatus Riesia pediculischaeffi]KIE63783.1 putative protease sohB [Candidatus Riesia pediculischaeffi PTSU]